MEAITGSFFLKLVSLLGTIVTLGIVALGLYILIKAPIWRREENRYADETAAAPCLSCGSLFGSDAVEAARNELADMKKRAR